MEVSTATMSRRISRLPGGWPLKKSPRVAKSATRRPAGLWRWLASRFDARRLVFVDESGFSYLHDAPQGEGAQRKAGVWQGPEEPGQEPDPHRLDDASKEGWARACP